MRTTATIDEIIYANWLKNVEINELPKNQLEFLNDDRFNFLPKLLKFEDESIIKSSNLTIFRNVDSLLNDSIIQRFKMEFINRFFHRCIKYQTYELFNAILVSYISLNRETIDLVYTNVGSLLLSRKVNTSDSESHNSDMSRQNNINTNLPQTQVTVSLEDESLQYADSVQISKNKKENTSDSSSESSSVQYSIDEVKKFKKMKEEIFREIDKLLFSQML